MGDKNGQPAKHLKINSVAVGGVNIKVKKTDDIRKEEPRETVGDYLPPLMDDPGTSKAIDDIVMGEGNEVLAAEDATVRSLNRPVIKKKSGFSFKGIYKNKWLYIGLGIVIVALFGIPFTRYPILGLVIKKDYPISVIDSTTNKPVSGAVVAAGGITGTTNAYGQINLKLPVGRRLFKISKQYYQSTSVNIFVGFSNKKGDTLYLAATGRQVPISVINKLSGKPISGAHITVLNTSAITKSSGESQIVLPTKKLTYQASITATGYNSLTMPIEVTTNKSVNIIRLVPSGYVYYLSNATGTINVIKANLDGSDPTIELAGTGQETAQTSLIPSPDWQYLVLEAQRSSSQNELYVIDASNGNLSEFDSAPDSFNLIGWSGDQFIYDEIATSENTSTVGREQIKSYNAPKGQLNVLDQDQAVGSSSSYGYQSFGNFKLLPNDLLYTTSWNSVASYDLSSQNDTLRGVEPTGLNKVDYSTYQASVTGIMGLIKAQPSILYLAVPNTQDNQTSYYKYSNGSLTTATSANYSATYPNYYLSPSGEETLWSSNSAIYTSNATGGNAKKVNIPSGYTAAGWYDNVYIFLTKGNLLYIAPANGSVKPTFIANVMNWS